MHRGLHYLSNLATDKYEAVRGVVARFLNAGAETEIVLNSGTTEGINAATAPRELFFKQKTAYEIGVRLVGSEMCIRDRGIFEKFPCEAVYGLSLIHI